jgi:hypothetical protein
MRDTVVDGLQKTSYGIDDKEQKIVVKEEVNVKPHLKHNKTLYNLNDGYSKSKELKRVASIPTIALSVWANEFDSNSKGNWWGLPKQVQNKILKTKLNSNEFRYFRTAQGKI